MLKYLGLFLTLTCVFAACETPKDTEISNDYQQRMEEKLYPYEGYHKAKNYPFETFGLTAYKSGMKQASQNMSQSRAGQWTQQGPGNIGGRVNTIEVNPQNPNEIMLGYSLGGIFKTINRGITWYPVFDDQITLSLSDITYDPNNPSIVYAGTGDLNISGYPVTGNGVYKSVDGGETWAQSGLTEAGIIAEIVVSHQNSDIVYAASMGVPFDLNPDRGLYKSTDGGETWAQMLSINSYTGIIDIEVSTTDDDIIYAASWSRVSAYTQNFLSSAITRILKSTDGGETWDFLSDDLPTGSLVRPGLAMFPDDHDLVYAMFSKYIDDEDEEAECTGGYYIEGIYKTEDGGDSWDPLDLSFNTGWDCDVVGGFSWYFGTIKVNPSNPDDIFVLGIGMQRSRNGGASWEEATPPWWWYEVHADKHDLVFSGSEMLLATDGGVYRSFIDFGEWEDIEDIVATQFYRVATSPARPDLYFGGSQDNGTTGGNADDIDDWPRIFGGDGFGVAFHPTDTTIMYAETQRGRIYRLENNEFGFESYRLTDTLSDEGRVNWDMPYLIGAADPSIVYCGREKVWRTINQEQDLWEAMSPVLIDEDFVTEATSHNISALAQSTVNPDMFFVGTSDGYLWRTLDDGEHWEKVGNDMPERYFSDVRPSPNDASRVYVSITGYEDNDNTPYIYMSQDSGRTYIQIAGDMPQIAVNDILIPPDQDTEDVIVIATDAGVYVTTDTGATWHRLGNNMPIMPVYDLAYNTVTDELVAGSFARGIWSIPMADVESVDTEDRLADLAATIYPTLATDYITVEGKHRGYNYSIYTIDGKRTLTGNIQSGAQIDISGLSNGYYIMRLENEGKAVARKFVKG